LRTRLWPFDQRATCVIPSPAELRESLNYIDRSVPDRLDVHGVLDNGFRQDGTVARPDAGSSAGRPVRADNDRWNLMSWSVRSRTRSHSQS
jgi:hypothetical protein